MNRKCEVRQLHLVTYENGMRMQDTLVGLRQRNEIDDQLLLLEHPPVITLGRGGDAANLLAPADTLGAAGIRFYETTRGGDITYHGPGQIVGYPIIHLGEGSRDVRKYVTKIEEVLIRTLRHFGIESTREDGMRGVWVGREKVAAIGVRIARWVTSHGFALNAGPDLDHFRLITPCGIQGSGVTSMERLLGRAVPMEEIKPVLVAQFAEVFERQVIPPSDSDLRIVKVVVHDARGRVLLLHRRAGDFWQPITGRIEPAESELECAERELFEETGRSLRPVTMKLRQSFTIDPAYVGSKNAFLFADEASFAAVIEDHEPLRLDAEEHDAYRWFTFEEALEKVTWSNDRHSIEQLRSELMSVSA